MLLTQGRVEERIWRYVRDLPALHATATEIAQATGAEVDDARHVLDGLVARSLLRRFETPGLAPIYWS